MMRIETSQNSRKKYIFYVLASVIAHLAFFFTIAAYSDFLLISELQRLLDHRVIDKTKDLSTQIELIDDEDNRKQIVEQTLNPINEAAPEKADFFSANNQKVDQQTKAKYNGKFRNGTKPVVVKKANQIAMVSAVKMLELQEQTESVATSDEKLGLHGLKPSLNKNLIIKKMFNMDKALAADMVENPIASGPSQTDDYLEDIEEGEVTLLNTKRFKFFSFYSRVKDQLRSNWNPLIREEVSFIYATNRSLASLGKKKTSLKITLNKRGYLEEIALLKTSGNKAIDAAAIQAFRLAAPFPNPPREILEKDKKIRILWDFVLET